MKTIQSCVNSAGHLLRVALVLVWLLPAGVEWCAGQEEKEKPKADAADPFVKDREAKGNANAKPKEGGEAKAKNQGEPVQFENIAQVIEFIEVPHTDVQKWLKANPGAPDGDALREEVQKWIEGGSAEILSSQMMIGRSGQRSKVQSIRELIYPTEFDPIKWSPAAPFSIAFETQNLGATLEADPVLEDGRIITNLATEYVEYIGECEQRPEPEGTVQAGDVRVPLIHTIRPSLQFHSKPGEWRLLTVETARSENADLTGETLNPQRSVLVLSRSSIHAFEVPVADEDDNQGNQWGYLQAEWIDVDADAAEAWMRREDFGAWLGDRDAARQAVDALVDKGQAEVVFTRLIPFRSGQRLKSESIREVIYPQQFDRSEQFALSGANVHETRNTGTTIEADPVVADGGAMVDLNFAAETVDLVGHSVSQRYFDTRSKQWKPDAMMPIFYSLQQNTQVNLLWDHPLLVGMMMPHDADGQPDRSRRRLLFLKVMQ